MLVQLYHYQFYVKKYAIPNQSNVLLCSSQNNRAKLGTSHFISSSIRDEIIKNLYTTQSCIACKTHHCHILLSRFLAKLLERCVGTLRNSTGMLGNGTGTLRNGMGPVQGRCWNGFLTIFITPSSRHRPVKRYLDSYLERYGISKVAPTYRNIIRQYLTVMKTQTRKDHELLFAEFIYFRY